MKRNTHVFASLLMLSVTSLLTVTHAQETHSTDLSIDQLAFFAGHWSGEMFDGVGETAWFAPKSGTMLGAFRLIKDGKTVFSQFMIVQETDNGVILRLEHYNNDYSTWEDARGTGPFEFRLVSVEDQKAVFTSINEHTPDYSHHRITDDGQLAVKIASYDEEGNEESFEVFYDRLHSSQLLSP